MSRAHARNTEDGVNWLDMDLVGRVVDAYLCTLEGPDAARLRFFEGLWDLQSQIEISERSYEPPAPDAARGAFMSGQPLFMVSPPKLPRVEYLDAVSRIVRYTCDMSGLPDRQADALRTADFAAVIDEKRLEGALRCIDEFIEGVTDNLPAGKEGAPTRATCAFVLSSALVPFLTVPSREALEALRGLDQLQSPTDRCPVCGSTVTMGRVGERTTLQGAQRTLWCGLCHAEWGCERIRCVHCGNRNSDSLRYTYVEGDPAHRLHLCDGCHSYTRFVFTEDLDKPVSMVVENAATLTLDALARDMGYTSTGEVFEAV
jgi:FdhE protein